MEATAPLLPYWSWPILAAAISALLTEAAIRYARRRALFDQPGQRRMHAVATPRGGGVGIVVALLLLTLMQVHSSVAQPIVFAGAFGLVVVAAVGAWDDHAAIGALPRLAAHFLAAVTFVAAIGSVLLHAAGGLSDTFSMIVAAALGTFCVLGIVWSINLHNFMDGINGLLAMQATFLFATLAFLASGRAGWFCVAAAAATLAFLPFNFPKARVFMGDVGSGALGFAIAAVALAHVTEEISVPVVLILGSGFIVDATATLSSRMLRGRRWYSAHREHLYQWLARSGFGHARVVGFYALWNFCIALPCAIALVHGQKLLETGGANNTVTIAWSIPPLWLVPAVMLFGAVVWCLGKRWCLRHARTHAWTRLRARAAARTRGGAHAH